MTAAEPFRVLVVDDDAQMLRLETKLLRRAGFELECAESGEIGFAHLAAARAEGRPFALMICDMQMGGWTGAQTVARAWEVDPELQVAMCTGSQCVTADFPRAHLDSLLIIKKPFEPVELVQTALALTAKWRVSQQMRAYTLDLEQAVRERTAELEATNRALAAQLAWRDQVEAEMRVSHRLEAVGQLAAGVAHEINTPVQYVGDNVQFLAESSTELLAAFDALRELAIEYGGTPATEAVAVIEAACDIDYLRSELPQASQSIQHGVRRIGTIVGALKQLSHPGAREAQVADLHRAIESALEVSSHAYRYVADVVREFGDLPHVTCYVAELGQVFLNLIVNAAHAMDAKDRDRSQRGRLTIRTSRDGDCVVISIADTGSGIPDAIRDRIFDPFFTTKEIGRGTGQGLSIARSIVVDRHGGALTLETAAGAGTTFHIRIPIAGPAASAAAA